MIGHLEELYIVCAALVAGPLVAELFDSVRLVAASSRPGTHVSCTAISGPLPATAWALYSTSLLLQLVGRTGSRRARQYTATAASNHRQPALDTAALRCTVQLHCCNTPHHSRNESSLVINTIHLELRTSFVTTTRFKALPALSDFYVWNSLQTVSNIYSNGVD